MIPLSDNMITPSGKLSLYLYSQSSQIILMSKNIQYDHSDESVVAKMSESEKEYSGSRGVQKLAIPDADTSNPAVDNTSEKMGSGHSCSWTFQDPRTASRNAAASLSIGCLVNS